MSKRPLASWVPKTEMPTSLQRVALRSKVPSLLTGGAVASGKTSLALMMASQYTLEPHYRCLVLRKRFVDLSVPGNSLPRAKAWWPSFMRGAYTFRFPSGATVTFGHLTGRRISATAPLSSTGSSSTRPAKCRTSR